MADGPQSFSDWINQQQRGRVAPSAAVPRAQVDVSAMANATAGRSAQEIAGNDQDFLSWVIDIISRPLYGVTNKVQSHIDRSLDPSPGNVAAEVGNAILPIDFLTGMFSTDPSTHRTTSDMIEQTTDKFGAKFDPNYVDNESNVNPVLKGITGFIGDVALDPLTWIPGAQLVKVAGMGARGAKAAASGAKGALASAGAAAGRTAEREVTDTAADLARTLEEGAVDVPVSKTPDLQEPASIDIPSPALSTPVVPESVADQIKVNPRVAKMTEILDDLARERPKALPQADSGRAGVILSKDDWWQEYRRIAPKKTVTLKASGGLPARTITFKEFENMIKAGNVDAVSEANRMFRLYREKFAAAQRQGTPGVVDAVGNFIPGTARKVTPPPTEATPVETLASMRQRFEELLAQDLDRVEASLGNVLVDQLRRTTNPERFEEVIQRLSEVLRPTTDLSDITDLTGQPALRKLFKTLDIDPIATNAARRQATSNVGGPNVNEALERMADPKLGAISQVDEDVLKSLPAVVKGNFFDLDSYKFETRGGTKRTEQGFGKGLGRDERAMNTHYQWDFLHKLTDRASERVKKMTQVKAGPGRAAVVDAEVMPALLKGEELLDQHGIPMYLDFAGEKLPLSLGQVLEVLHADTPLMRQVLFNVETTVPTTNLADAVFFAVKKDASWDVVNAQLAKIDKRNLKEGVIPNPLTSGGAGRLRYGYTPNRGKKPADTEDFRYVAHKEGRTLKGWYKVWDADRIRARLTDNIMAQVSRLKEIAAQNAEAYARRLTAETLDLTQQQVDELTALVLDPEQLGAAIRAVGDVSSRIQREAWEAGTLKESSDAATVLVTESAPDLAISNAEAAIKVADTGKREAVKAGKSGKKPKEQAKAIPEAGKPTAQKAANDQADEADRIAAEFDPSGATRNWSESAAAYRAVKAGVVAKLDPLYRMFNYRAGMQNVHDLMNNAGALFGNWTALRHIKMNELNRLYGGLVPGTETPILRQAFQDMQQGVRSSDPTVAAAYRELSRMMSDLVDPTGEQLLLGNAFFRNNVGLDHLNAMMDKLGIPHQIDIESAAKAAKEKGTDLLSEAAQQWRTWTIDDPLDFISKFDHAAMRLFTDYSVGQGFMRRASKEGWISDVPQAGYSRLISTDGSAIAAALPKNIYIRDDVLTELKNLEEVMYASRQIDGELGYFIKRYFDPVQSAWKKGITVYRPGHHVRNMVGDSSMTFVAEGVKGYVKSSRDAFKVMQLRNQYEGVDIARALKELGEYRLTGQGDVIASGKFGDMSASDLYDVAERAGLFRNARVVEDYVDEGLQFGEDGKGIVAKLAEKASFTGTRVEKVAMGVSEYREHYARLQHFLQIIEKAQKTGKFDDGFRGSRKPKDAEELFRLASDRVKRYHPDVSMLSPFELRYMRRLIPFYSWFRGVLPAIVESLLVHPGRVSVFPKASYNLAVAMGVDPNSLSDPFPTDQLFPSFLSEQVTGPQFQIGDTYFGINPGIAHIDVMNSLFADPLRGTAGMVSPLLRIPAELLSGGSWGTGAQIKDDSDYIDSSLPIINYLANISGFSPTGSVVSLVQGQGLDPQYQQAAGNKGPADQWLSVLNWLTGFGVNNQSKPNYINYAEIERRNKAGEQASGF